ncbi:MULTISPECIES: hypothetical protein [unclassified Roseitalea]|uniref:hypothetical protein n=1 Tax=unclassified Roseitalea TaxID=2639107 RepID=UPI00273D30A5|nr:MULTISPECIES: hypothetical protein [unclassified Roseitalea]
MSPWWILAGVVGIVTIFIARPFVVNSSNRAEEPALSDGMHFVQLVTGEASASCPAFHQWFETAELEDILPGSRLIPAVERSELIAGTWGEADGVRRVHLADGTTALEKVLIDRGSDQFAYKVWPETGAGAKLVEYIRGEFLMAETEAGNCRIEWRYALRPRRGAGLHALLYSHFAVRPFLQNGLRQIIEVGQTRAL